MARKNAPSHDHILKFLMVGDQDSGKTSLLTTYVDDEFDTNTRSTLGVDLKVKILNHRNKKIKLTVAIDDRLNTNNNSGVADNMTSFLAASEVKKLRKKINGILKFAFKSAGKNESNDLSIREFSNLLEMLGIQVSNKGCELFFRDILRNYLISGHYLQYYQFKQAFFMSDATIMQLIQTSNDLTPQQILRKHIKNYYLQIAKNHKQNRSKILNTAWSLFVTEKNVQLTYNMFQEGIQFLNVKLGESEIRHIFNDINVQQKCAQPGLISKDEFRNDLKKDVPVALEGVVDVRTIIFDNLARHLKSFKGTKSPQFMAMMDNKANHNKYKSLFDEPILTTEERIALAQSREKNNEFADAQDDTLQDIVTAMATNDNDNKNEDGNEMNEAEFRRLYNVEHKKEENIENTKSMKKIESNSKQKRFGTLTTAYYREAQCVILVYNVYSITSFENISEWLKEVDTFTTNKNIVKVLVGTLDNLESKFKSKRKVTHQDGSKFAKENKMLFLETSIKSASGVNELFVAAVDKVLDDPDLYQDQSKNVAKINEQSYSNETKEEEKLQTTNLNTKGLIANNEQTKQKDKNVRKNKQGNNGKRFGGNLSIVSRKDIKDPLIAMIGIGKYDKEMDNLDGMEVDYQNMYDLFGEKYNYSLFFLDKNDHRLSYNSKDMSKSLQFKIEWTKKEIMSFIDKARFECQAKNHDSMIFIVSSHGTNRNMILDSHNQRFALKVLFEYFNGSSCHYLVDKPKLFIIDCCRGSGMSNPIQTDHTEHKDDEKQSESIKLKQIDNSLNDLYFHSDANFCFIFANTEGYATADGCKNGGFLIRNVKKVFNELDFVSQNNLDSIIRQIRKETKLETTIISEKFKELEITQIVENRSTIEDNVFFKPKKEI